MGSLNSHSTTNSSTEAFSGVNTPPRVRKSMRLMEKFRNRQPSKSDLIAQTTNAIDPIKSHGAQDHGSGEVARSVDQDSTTTADVGECKQRKEETEA